MDVEARQGRLHRPAAGPGPGRRGGREAAGGGGEEAADVQWPGAAAARTARSRITRNEGGWSLRNPPTFEKQNGGFRKIHPPYDYHGYFHDKFTAIVLLGLHYVLLRKAITFRRMFWTASSWIGLGVNLHSP